MTKSDNRSGQMLLVVVLTMIVALTVGLSVVSGTITNLRISRQNEESQRAFKAAEAGIEQALQPGAGFDTQNFSNNAGYSITRMNPEGTEFLLNGGELVDQSTGADLWLSEYPDFTNPVSGSVTVYWSTVDQNSCASTGGELVRSAIELAVLSGSITSPSLNKYVFDSCNRIAGELATPSIGGSVADVSFNYAATISVTNGLIMRIIPVYNSTKIGIKSNVALPPQGAIIESVGESGETVRKIQYYSSHPLIPFEIFPYSIISQ